MDRAFGCGHSAAISYDFFEDRTHDGRRYRLALDAFHQAYEQLSEAEDAVEEHRPSPLIQWRNYTISGSEIEDRRQSLLQHSALQPKRMKKNIK